MTPRVETFQAIRQFELRLADFDRRHPHLTPAAMAARRARALDVDMDRLERRARARRWRLAVVGLVVGLAPFRLRCAWRQRAYALARADRRAVADLWIARRVLGASR